MAAFSFADDSFTGFDQSSFIQEMQEMDALGEICYSKKSEVECNSFVDEQGEKP